MGVFEPRGGISRRPGAPWLGPTPPRPRRRRGGPSEERGEGGEGPRARPPQPPRRRQRGPGPTDATKSGGARDSSLAGLARRERPEAPLRPRLARQRSRRLLRLVVAAREWSWSRRRRRRRRRGPSEESPVPRPPTPLFPSTLPGPSPPRRREQRGQLQIKPLLYGPLRWSGREPPPPASRHASPVCFRSS